MLNKQQALDHGILEQMWDSARESGYTLRRVIPHAVWEHQDTRNHRRTIIQAPFTKLLHKYAPSTDSMLEVAKVVDGIMEALDNFVED